MPRLARLDTPGALHHVMIRGIVGCDIFRDNKDRDNLLSRLEDLLPKTKTSCYAWSLLSNHAHFLFRAGTTGLSILMKKILTGYAVSFNRRHSRRGPLFQDRFKSIICQEDAYLKELVRYIHLNPLRAGIVSDLSHLNRYKYCGHTVLMGKRKCEWMDTKYVLSYFGKTVSKARGLYCSYVKQGIELGRRPELVGGGLIRSLGGWQAIKEMRTDSKTRERGDLRILGDSGFVLDVLKEADEKFERRYEMKRLGYDLKTIEDRVCEIYGIEKDDIYSGSRKKVNSSARSLFCFWAVRELGYTQRDLARRLGITPPAVGYAVDRGEKISKLHHYDLIN